MVQERSEVVTTDTREVLEAAAGRLTIYCDSRSDEILAREWLTGAGFAGATITALPRGLARAPEALRAVLQWERLDWLVVVDGRVVCGVELSRHGYTGDQSFQRFARLYRCADLGIPVIYFTAFNRTRLNEIEEGRLAARNAAPELFQTLDTLSREKAVPCVAVDWTTGADGTPLPLRSPAVRPALQRLADLVAFFLANGNTGDNSSLEAVFPDVLDQMRTQAALPYTGSETRGVVNLPIDPTSPEWVFRWLPANYFSSGKADKALASLALRETTARRVVARAGQDEWWLRPGRAQVLYLGYQWRPDPACGLIALSATLAKTAGLPLVVVWPRVYYEDGAARRAAMRSLRDFAATGAGALTAEMARLGFDDDKVARFKARVNTDGDQFGIFSRNSKVSRILSETAQMVVFGDVALIP